MRDISNIIVLRTIRKFESKKNRVELCEICLHDEHVLAVRKRFSKKTSMENERYFHDLFLFAGNSVPQLLAEGSRELYYDYVPGRNYLFALEDWEKEMSGFAIWERLAAWLVTFYLRSDGVILGDPNLRNFILDCNGCVWGIDFEECGRGDVQSDIARLLAYILTYSPSYTQGKQRICDFLIQYLSQQLSLSQSVLRSCLYIQIKELETRRALEGASS